MFPLFPEGSPPPCYEFRHIEKCAGFTVKIDLANITCKADLDPLHSIDFNLRFVRTNSGQKVKDYIDEPFRVKYVYTKHGETLLSLPQNYGILSLSLLGSGVETKTLDINDNTDQCYAGLSKKERYLFIKDKMTKALLFDQTKSEDSKDSKEKDCNEDEESCGNKRLEKLCFLFEDSYRCIHTEKFPTDRNRTCLKLVEKVVPQNEWIRYMYAVLEWAELYFLLFGPALLLRVIGGKHRYFEIV